MSQNEIGQVSTYYTALHVMKLMKHYVDYHHHHADDRCHLDIRGHADHIKYELCSFIYSRWSYVQVVEVIYFQVYKVIGFFLLRDPYPYPYPYCYGTLGILPSYLRTVNCMEWLNKTLFLFSLLFVPLAGIVLWIRTRLGQ